MSAILKILHVVVDDKFIDMAIREFEAVAPGIHEYVLIGPYGPSRYVSSPLIRILTEKMFLHELKRTELKAIIFHTLPGERYRLLAQIPENKKVFWLGWGYDYYDCLLGKAFPAGLLLPATAALARATPKRKPFATLRRAIRKGLQLPFLITRPPDISALKRVDYFSPVLDSEFHIARRLNPWFTPEHICWNYGTVEDDLTISGVRGGLPGENILVGNSAFETNNHYEAFELIQRQLDISRRKVIVPLSYGSPEYRDKVLDFGPQLLGDAFTPLVDYMSKDAYIETLTSCGFFVMNHIRQQALGNIIIAVLLGAKIFLNRNSPLYNWLQARGLVIGDVAALDTQALEIGTRRGNIAAVQAFWGRDAQRQKTMRLVDVALG